MSLDPPTKLKKELSRACSARHRDAGRIILILDSTRYKHAKIVREHIENTHVELKFLPSYLPNLNLIERYGSSSRTR